MCALQVTHLNFMSVGIRFFLGESENEMRCFYDLSGTHASHDCFYTNLCISLLRKMGQIETLRNTVVLLKKCCMLCKQVFRKFCARIISQLDHAHCGRSGIWKHQNESAKISSYFVTKIDITDMQVLLESKVLFSYLMRPCGCRSCCSIK